MCDPLNCIFHFLATIKLMEWSHSGRVARKVVVSGVWPLSAFGRLLYLVSMQEVNVRL